MKDSKRKVEEYISFKRKKINKAWKKYFNSFCILESVPDGNKKHVKSLLCKVSRQKLEKLDFNPNGSFTRE